MICDRCKKNQANIFYTVLIEGRAQEVHLCYECANEIMEENFKVAGGEDFLNNLVKNIFNFTSNQEEEDEDLDIECSHCHTRYGEYRKTGVVGCEFCYSVFKPVIVSNLEKSQGSSYHRGNIPPSAIDTTNLIRRERELMGDLNIAISMEDYEKAADVRDKLKELRKNC